MSYVKWTIFVVFWGLVASVLYYTLPRHDVVRIVNTEVRRVDFGDNSLFWANAGSGDAEGTVSRDIYFIATVRPSERPRVFRNEDTGWVWPPYFKLNSSNLQAKAANLTSSTENPKWVSVRFYGWRFEPLSIYPNAVSMKQVDGPDYSGINWFNIIFLTGFAGVVYALHRRLRKFRETRLDPVLDDVTDRFEAAGDAMESRRGRFRRWLDAWKQT